MIKGKLLKEGCENFRDISTEDFPSREDSERLSALAFFRHIDESWFEEILQESKIKGIKPLTARRLVTASIRKMMEDKKR